MNPEQSKPFNISTQNAPGCDESVALIALEGYLDGHTTADFDEETEASLREGRNRMILDAERLNYISSAGIGSLMRLVQETRRQGGDLVLLRPPERILGILELLGFAEILVFAESLEEATRKLLD